MVQMVLVKPLSTLLEQAGLEASSPDRSSCSTVTFVIQRMTNILGSDCALHEFVQFQLASVKHQEALHGKQFPPERQMASRAPAKGFADGNEVKHLFVSNVNQTEQYEHWVQGS